MTAVARYTVPAGSSDHSPEETPRPAREKFAMGSPPRNAGPQADDARLTGNEPTRPGSHSHEAPGNGDDELAPWVEVPGGGLEWRGW